MLDYHYYTFLKTCETLNFTVAAKELNMSQPTVSNHIAYLEKRLSVTLFIQKNKRLYMTDAATLLYEKTSYLARYSKQISIDIQSIKAHI
ncbi:hypothetical protein DOK67_0001093 [Enterococcus sp. DIV0212c]|uniref:helix-turn-helix domain-containing protein n=1 Tax=Enterococcus sp. DIV0212c TaxID=2230867 RepID=UPI001A9B856D|nr:LysR family transcriptional regulator [Enterococcus sp. DIV0212c]MBO1354451.1 LysR family transcriptional regulator [Enterococcus sp. DIV0212c]